MTTTTEPVTYLLHGGRGTIELLPDGRGVVRDLAGRAVVTLPRTALPPEMFSGRGGVHTDR
jgi:hypothetical protein